MNPQDQQPRQPQNQQPSQRQASDSTNQRDAASNIIRDQINKLFGDPTGAESRSEPAQASQPTTNSSAATQSRQYMQQQPRPNTPLSSARSQTVERARTVVEPSNIAPTQDPQPTTPPQAQPVANQPAPQPSAQQSAEPNQDANTPASSYARTQQNTGTVSEDQWRKYHSSWQQYYQQYYERYYAQSLASEKQKHQDLAVQPAQASATTSSQTDQTSHGSSSDSVSDKPLTKGQAVRELRSQIRDKMSNSAVKVRKSRHFIPILAAFGVLILFLFLQYNRVLFASVEAYIAPGTVEPGDIIVDPTSTEAIDDEPKLIIPKLNINVPTQYEDTMGSTNKQTYDKQMKAMEAGVAWFGIPGADSKPGQNGNTVISGHSSNDVIDPGGYKFIFARLDKLKKGDTIYLNYKGTRYTYSVTGTKVVKPTELKALQVGDDKPVLTLITCTPLGTSLNRLLVFADQISPDPAGASEAKDFDKSTADSAEMPGNSPTMLKRIFGGGNN